jgi:hypothetical protein
MWFFKYRPTYIMHCTLCHSFDIIFLCTTIVKSKNSYCVLLLYVNTLNFRLHSPMIVIDVAETCSWWYSLQYILCWWTLCFIEQYYGLHWQWSKSTVFCHCTQTVGTVNTLETMFRNRRLSKTIRMYLPWQRLIKQVRSSSILLNLLSHCKVQLSV